MKALCLLALVAACSAQCNSVTPSSGTPSTRTYMFGNNFYGQLGFPENNTVTPKFSHIGSERTTRNSACFGGFMTSGAIVKGTFDKAFFAGDSNQGALGFGAAYEQAFRRFLSPTDSLPHLAKEGSAAVSMANLNVADVCMGWSHTCMIVFDSANPTMRKVMCSGSNAVNQLGVSTFVNGRFQLFQPVLNSRRDSRNFRTDTVFNSTVNFDRLHCGGDFTIAVTTDGQLYGWGSNALGQLGAGSATSVDLATPITLPDLTAGDRVRTVATGFASTTVVTTTGAVYVFGSNAERQLGIGSATPTKVTVPMKVSTGVLANLGSSIRSISCGGYHCIAVAGGTVSDTTSGRVYSWGEGTLGPLGLPTPAGSTSSRWYVNEPTLVPGLETYAVNMLATGHKHSLVLDNCGAVHAFGSDAFGQTGMGGANAQSNFRVPTPTPIPFVTSNNLRVRYICAGAFHSGLISIA